MKTAEVMFNQYCGSKIIDMRRLTNEWWKLQLCVLQS